MNHELTVSLAICTMDRCEEVLICVRSILQQEFLPKELVIIDSSDNAILEKELNILLKDSDIELNYINVKANLTKARNIAIDQSNQKIICFLDDDTVLDKNYLKEIVRVFEKNLHDNIGGVSGNIINGYQSFSRDIFNKLFFLFRYSDGKFRLSGIQTFVHKKVNKIVPVEGLSGANMSFKRDVIKNITFDEDSPCSEDDDIAWRVSKEFQNFYTPFALIEHNPSSIGGGYGKRSQRWVQEIQGLHNHFTKNIPNTLKHRIAFSISLLGLVLNEIINIILLKKGSLSQLIGVLKGIASLYK